jgi:hypothetical protein
VKQVKKSNLPRKVLSTKPKPEPIVTYRIVQFTDGVETGRGGEWSESQYESLLEASRAFEYLKKESS